jgi:hypothetical protein
MAGSLDYFNRVKHSDNTGEGLYKQYQQDTQGLDQDVAFEALDGGRFFGESDRKRYDELMANRSQAKETAQTYKNNTSQSISAPQSNTNTQQATSNANTNISQTQSFDREFGDNQNTIGNDNEIFGNVNQGNQDFSVNIGNQQAGSGSRGGMSNLEYGAASKAMMENSYNRDRATFSAAGEAGATAARANSVTGASNRINKLDQATDQNIDYFRKASDRATMGLYGDIWNAKAPTWKAPGELDPIEVTYNKD